MTLALDAPAVAPLHDPALPTLLPALDHAVAERALRASLAGRKGDLALEALRLIRHKAGRRFLVEYDVALSRDGEPAERLTVIAKVRRNRTGERGLELARALWAGGFDAGAADGIAVPEPLGHVPALHAWLQRKVAGVPVADVVAEPYGPALMRRVAGAANKVHRAGIAPRRAHTMADELRILGERLSALAQQRPQLAARLMRVLAACDRLGASVPAAVPCGIHRDFYGDQVIVDGGRLWLLDFDLYCAGDPALDAGNFVGHLSEQGVREHGDVTALEGAEAAFEDAFVALAGAASRPALRAYAVLTLVRHIELSTHLAGRAELTETLLELCEARLGLASGRP